MAEDNELSLTIIDNSIEVFRSGSKILQNHKKKAEAAMRIADDLLAKWKMANEIEDPDEKAIALSAIDDETQKFLIKCRDRLKERFDERSPLTQIMTTIATTFTKEEALLDIKKSSKLIEAQNYRNNYTKWRLAETARKEKENADRAYKAKEETEIRAAVNTSISNWLLNVLSTKKAKANESFNIITLVNLEEKKGKLSEMNVSFPKETLVKMIIDRPPFRYHTLAEVDIIKAGVSAGYDYDKFYAEYSKEVQTLKRQLIDKLPSKKAELDEEAKRRIAEEKAEAERQRLAKEAKGKAEKERIERQNELDRQRAEQERIDAENNRLLREEQERQRLKQEADDKLRKEQERIELEKIGENAKTLFDQTVGNASDKPAPAAKINFVIDVKHQAGWTQIFQFYYEEKGCDLPLEDWENLTMKQIKTFVEKSAKEKGDKPGRMIESKFIEYREEVKAINKKEKEKTS